MADRLARMGVLVSLLLVGQMAVFGGSGVATAAPEPTTDPAPIEQVIGDNATPDSVLLSAALEPSGNATWRIVYRITLEDESEEAAFDSLQEDVRTNRSDYITRFGDRIGRTVSAAENTTGRSMGVSNVTVRTDRDSLQGYGIVSYSFTWGGFATTPADRLVAGDALAGLFLDRRTSLRISWGSGYEPRTVAPAPTDRGPQAVTWAGPMEFGSDKPRVVLGPSRSDGTADTADQASGGTPTRGLPSGILVAALLAILATVAWLLYDRNRADETAGSGSSPPTDGDSSPTEPPSDLLSDEERVRAMLENNGGRVRQADLADQLDWTDAKTSRVLNEMQEAGTIEKFRLGRENVVSLPETDGQDE